MRPQFLSSMKQSVCTFSLTVLLALITTTGYAAPAHISDEVYTFYHGGPSNQYKITGRIRSGTAVTILNRNNETKYVQIKTPSGKVGWIHGDSVSSGTSMTVRFPRLEEQLKTNETLINQQSEQISELRQQSGGLQQENSGYTEKIVALEEEIVALNRTINGMDESNLMRWFTYGGLVAFGGLILGLMIPYLPKRRKRHDTW